MKTKKIPQRRCLACQEAKDKKDLMRIVRSPEGEISIDLTGRKPGRGAYLCRSEECLKKAEKTKAFQRALNFWVARVIFQDKLEKLFHHYLLQVLQPIL